MWLCCVATSDPRCFLPVTMYGTTHAHLVHMCWPLSWALDQMGHSFATFGASKEVGGCPQSKSKGCPQAKSKANRQKDWGVWLRYPPLQTPGLVRYGLPGGDCKGISRQTVVPSTDASKENTCEATFALMRCQCVSHTNVIEDPKER